MSELRFLSAFLGFLVLLGLAGRMTRSGLGSGRVTKNQAAVVAALLWAGMPWYFSIAGGVDISLVVLIWWTSVVFVGVVVTARLILNHLVRGDRDR